MLIGAVRSAERRTNPARAFLGAIKVPLSVLGAAGLAGSLAASAYYGIQLRATLRGNPAGWTGRGTLSGSPLRLTERRAGRRDTVTLDASRPALWLVYSSSCGVCGYNMARWLDLIRELREAGSDADVYAIDVDGRDSLGAFWPPVRGVRRLTPLDTKAFVSSTGVHATPASVVVRADGVEPMLPGLLGPHRRSYLLARLRAQ